MVHYWLNVLLLFTVFPRVCLLYVYVTLDLIGLCIWMVVMETVVCHHAGRAMSMRNMLRWVLVLRSLEGMINRMYGVYVLAYNYVRCVVSAETTCT